MVRDDLAGDEIVMGMFWLGMKWLVMKWSGMKWSGTKWSGMKVSWGYFGWGWKCHGDILAGDEMVGDEFVRGWVCRGWYWGDDFTFLMSIHYSKYISKQEQFISSFINNSAKMSQSAKMTLLPNIPNRQFFVIFADWHFSSFVPIGNFWQARKMYN